MLWLVGVLAIGVNPEAAENGRPQEFRAARSVHLGWLAPEGRLFYNELVVEQSAPGSYFMACGWNTGYFGIQELADRRKVILFSVWDPTRGDDPAAVPLEQRVEVLHADPAARVRRFGGEGTGGQCLMEFPWELGQTNRFLVAGVVTQEKTAYAGYIYRPDRRCWQHLVTFRTRTGGEPLKGYYSFVEDFRRDGQSVRDLRRARFGRGWVQAVSGDWIALTQARFTASNADWEAKDNIDAGREGNDLFLVTGGETKCTTPLLSILSRPPPGLDLPADIPSHPTR